MGKSEKKSKIKRKHRALKRLKNQPKEILRLNKIIERRIDTNLVNSENVDQGKFSFN